MGSKQGESSQPRQEVTSLAKLAKFTSWFSFSPEAHAESAGADPGQAAGDPEGETTRKRTHPLAHMLTALLSHANSFDLTCERL